MYIVEYQISDIYYNIMKIYHKTNYKIYKHNFPFEILIQENQTLDGIETSMGVHLLR